ncbi:hypothetical protein EDD15DRAFT_2218438 [Pisolithus albus]|nr:hypothetical protein EDD15DRAFT_2218438 [Pisolithus albus]
MSSTCMYVSFLTLPNCEAALYKYTGPPGSPGPRMRGWFGIFIHGVRTVVEDMYIGINHEYLYTSRYPHHMACGICLRHIDAYGCWLARE